MHTVRHRRYLLSLVAPSQQNKNNRCKVCSFSLYNFCPKHTPDRWIFSPLQLRRLQKYVKSVPFGAVAQIPGARSPGRLKFVRWCLTFVCLKYVSLLAPTILRCKSAMLSGLKQKWKMPTNFSTIIRHQASKKFAPLSAKCSHTQTTAKLTGACLRSRMVAKIVCYVRYVRLSACISATTIGRISVKYDTEYF